MAVTREELGCARLRRRGRPACAAHDTCRPVLSYDANGRVIEETVKWAA